MKKLFLCLALIAGIVAGNLNAQTKKYTVTRSIALGITWSCLNDKGVDGFCKGILREKGVYSFKDQDIIIRNLETHLDYAEILIIALYDRLGVDKTYFALRDWLTLSDIELTQNIWIQDGLVKEKERQAREEKEAKERAAKEREMQLKINAFLAMRDTIVFPMKSDMSVYNSNSHALQECVKRSASVFDLKPLDLHIIDDLTVDYNGVAQHDIKITGMGSDNVELVNTLKEAMMQVKLTTLAQIEPTSKQSFPVTSKGTFEFNYTASSHAYNLRVIKKGDEILLKKGDIQAFNEHKNYLAENLSKRGRYDLSLNVAEFCGTTSQSHLIEDFRRPIDNVFLEYCYSPTAPAVLTLGFNKIAYTRWGVYMRYKSAFRKIDDTNFEYTTTKPEKNGYIHDAFTAGTTLSILKILYLYGGVGYGACAVAYSNKGIGYTDGSSAFYRASTIKGLEVEAGCRWRIKMLGVSAGYAAIFPLSDGAGWGFGDVNFGVSLFF